MVSWASVSAPAGQEPERYSTPDFMMRFILHSPSLVLIFHLKVQVAPEYVHVFGLPAVVLHHMHDDIAAHDCSVGGSVAVAQFVIALTSAAGQSPAKPVAAMTARAQAMSNALVIVMESLLLDSESK